MLRIRFMFLVLVLSAAAGCSQVRVSDYSGFEPRMDMEEFFSGTLTAHGVVKNRGGRVIRSFSADIAAQWQDGEGVLDEDFVFDDGERDKRVWTLRPSGEGRYIGTAGDVVGQGRLQVAGNRVFLDYVLRVPYGDGTVDVRVDDRMYLLAPGVLLNESTMTKFGVEVGSILLVILRRDD